MSDDVIDLLSDDDGDDVVYAANGNSSAASSAIANTVSLDSSITTDKRNSANDDDDVILIDKPTAQKPATRPSVVNPYAKKRKTKNNNSNQAKKAAKKQNNKQTVTLQQRELQSGLVFEEDVDHIQQSHNTSSLKQSSLKKKSASLKRDDDTDSENEEDEVLSNPSSALEYADHQYTTRVMHHLPPVLFHDQEFTAGNPGTIDGIHKVNAKPMNKRYDNEGCDLSFNPPKCRCRPPLPCALSYSTREGPHFGRPYHTCCRKTNRCNHFSWAFTSYMIQWYRFGPHNGHNLVNSSGFRAEDLVQGKVGDCWFLSALAVVAEREDLISRLIGSNVTNNNNNKLAPNKCGIIEVTLFEDGYWKKFIMDDFLPCFIDQRSEKMENQQLQMALKLSLAQAGFDAHSIQASTSPQAKTKQKRVTSKFDPCAIPDENYKTLYGVRSFLQSDQHRKNATFHSSRSDFLSQSLEPLSRKPTISDLAYSKARNNQLWVPFIEKAYAKMHGSYKSISGGHVAEAFLDLTGAPTVVYNFDHHDFNPRQFWSDLMTFRKKRLPMGCGTSNSQAGIIGMHAYSILDVREVKNVGIDFFRDKVAQGTLGNVSGFTELDGTVRLLRIRNPHGKSEWKGDFSDKSPIWQKLMENRSNGVADSNGVLDLTKPTAPKSPELERTMKDDGVFWIDYDSFLMGFHNVDVVLAFEGNHAKSFGSNFAAKSSNHRCTRAFELSVVPRQPGEDSTNDRVEVFVMGIQKTRRGATHGRSDRKKSYKASDLGILVGECNNSEGPLQLDSVDGYFFGLTRNGHIRLVLDRRQNKRLVVMPLSFGHPAATDDERSFVVRFCADSPLLVSELAEPPNMNMAIQKYCFGDKIVSMGHVGTSFHRGSQGKLKTLMSATNDYSFLFQVVQVECMSGGGGTVLLYLLVNDEMYSLVSSKQDISFTVEINCRGMVCRTASGLQQHETISKGEKFKAAWRRFSLSFKSETKSRLLAAVVQGGQDYQLGSIKVEPMSKSADSHGAMSKFLDQSGTVMNKSDKYANYDEYGVFSTVSTDSALISKRNQPGGFGVFAQADQELALALKKSKQDFDSKTPIDLCGGDQRHDNSSLDAAIRASLLDQQKTHTSNKQKRDSYDEELEKAIALSLQNK